MIYIIIGTTNSGKSSFVKNTFIGNKEKIEKRDLLPLTFIDNICIIGKYNNNVRRGGTDTIARSHIHLIGEQVERLLNYDIVLEGDRCVSRKLFDKLKSFNVKCQLYWIKCSPKTSYERNLISSNNKSEMKLSYIAGSYNKCKNIFNEYYELFNGIIINTDKLCDNDFKKFSLDYALKNNLVEKYERKITLLDL